MYRAHDFKETLTSLDINTDLSNMTTPDLLDYHRELYWLKNELQIATGGDGYEEEIETAECVMNDIETKLGYTPAP